MEERIVANLTHIIEADHSHHRRHFPYRMCGAANRDEFVARHLAHVIGDDELLGFYADTTTTAKAVASDELIARLAFATIRQQGSH